MLERYTRWTNALLDVITSMRSTDSLETTRRARWLSSSQAQSLVDAARDAAARDLAPIAGAELSRRLRQDRIAINRRVVSFYSIDTDDWMIVTREQRDVPDAPHHLRRHQRVYAHTDAGAVLLVQPTYATLLGNAGVAVEEHWLREVIHWLPVQTGEFSPDTLTHSSGAWLLPGAGLLTWGEDETGVVEQAAQVEQLCRLTIINRQL